MGSVEKRLRNAAGIGPLGNAAFRVALFAVGTTIAPASWALCISPGEPKCVPDDPLAGPFVEARRNVRCHDVIDADEEGRDRDPPTPSPLTVFALNAGDAAIPFYEAVIAHCDDGDVGWRSVAFRALGALGSARAVAVLEDHARPGQPGRRSAVLALLRCPGFASSKTVAAMLREEPNLSAREAFAFWLWEHGDATALPALRDAMAKEKDDQVIQLMTFAARQLQDVDGCALADNRWSWRTLGNECHYRCRGVEYPIKRVVWGGVLPCAENISRGHLGGARGPVAGVLVFVTLSVLVRGAIRYRRRSPTRGVS
jgi:hypothetical protein